ncbi:MAG: hypothetical protein LBF41_10470 [Deltaproteobacteria bacterium]|jgi:hypothetical protein|nr:hypothetical protein [Deltaproteobacteria bacterium]
MIPKIPANREPREKRENREIREFEKSKKNAPPGFTLVEVLLTICVLAFGCLAVIQMQSWALRGTTFSDYQTAAVYIAETELERLKGLSWEDLEKEIDASTEVVTENLNRLGQSCHGCDRTTHPFKRTVKFFTETPTSFSHQIEVKVEWNDRGRPREVFYSCALTTYNF